MNSDLAMAKPVFEAVSVTAVTAGNGIKKCRYHSVYAAGNGVTAKPPKSPMCARVCAYAWEIIVTAVTPLPALFHAGFKVTDGKKHRYLAVTGEGVLMMGGLSTQHPCPACASAAGQQRPGGRYHFACVYCCARLIVHARPFKAAQEAHFSAIARFEQAPSKAAILDAIKGGQLVEVAA